VQANGSLLSAPAVSQSGALVAFDCTATNLLAGDTNGVADVFVRDVAGSATERVSLGAAASNRTGLPTIRRCRPTGACGVRERRVEPGCGCCGDAGVRARSQRTGTTSLVSTSTLGAGGNGPSRRPAISADGRFVAFTSAANDLVAGDTNGHSDVFVRNMQTGVMVRASVSSGGGQASGRLAVHAGHFGRRTLTSCSRASPPIW